MKILIFSKFIRTKFCSLESNQIDRLNFVKDIIEDNTKATINMCSIWT